MSLAPAECLVTYPSNH